MELLLHLLAGQDSLVAVDDDDMVTTVNVRSKGGLVLTAQDDSTLAATRPRGLPAASITYHLRSAISAGLARVVLIVGTSIEELTRPSYNGI